MPWLPDNLKDWVEMIATGGGVFGALVVFGVNSYTARQELRRKHAEAGRSLITEMTEDRESKNAFAMLDMEDGQKAFITDEEGNVASVAWETVVEAMNDIQKAEDEPLIRAAFDALFYYFALFEHSIQAGLVQKRDIDYPTSYYVKILGEYKKPFADYLVRYELKQAQAFLERWSTW